MSETGSNVRAGWLDRGTKYTKSWTKRYVVLDRAARRMTYAENDQKQPKGTVLLKRVVRSAEKNESLKAGNPDLHSLMVEGTEPESGKEVMWLLRCPGGSEQFQAWYSDIRQAISNHGLMDSLHYGLPDKDPRCDLPLVTVPTEFLFRFSLLDKAILYYFGVVQLAKPMDQQQQQQSGGGNNNSLQWVEHILVLCDKNNYLFNFAADVIRCFPVASLEVIRAGDNCVGLKLAHPQHDLIIRTAQPVQIIDILRRTFNVATGQDCDVESNETGPEQLVPGMNLRPYEGFQLTVSAPTPKQKLKHALDVYERQTGQPFVYGSAQNPAQQISKTAHHTADQMDVEDPMAALLMRLKLTQYVVLMQRQHLDLDVLRCMDESDLKSFGIQDSEHRQMIIDAVRGNGDEDLIQEASEGEMNAASNASGGGGGVVLNDSFGGPSSAGAAFATKRGIVLDDDDDDDMNIVLPNSKPIVLDDDDIVVLPKKNIVLEDSDEDLPIKPLGNAAPIGDDI